MFSRLFHGRSPASKPNMPQRVYAIGDVHGCAAQLDRLIAAIDADDQACGGPPGTIILLGDLIDRGPDSAGVVERLIALRRERPSTRFLMGNHEEILLGAIEGETGALRMFTRIGGIETILSYGVSEQEYVDVDFDGLQALLRERIPAAHLAFIRGFEDMIISGDYVFVHAGIRPGLPLSDQKTKDLRWIRERFLADTAMHEKFIVHGHTITEDVDDRPNRLGIDTGCYLSGRLTAVALEEDRRWFLHT